MKAYSGPSTHNHFNCNLLADTTITSLLASGFRGIYTMEL